MCSCSLTPVSFPDPLSHAKSVRTLFTNRAEQNGSYVPFVYSTKYVKKQSSYVAEMSTHASFRFPTVLKYNNLHF